MSYYTSPSPRQTRVVPGVTVHEKHKWFFTLPLPHSWWCPESFSLTDCGTQASPPAGRAVDSSFTCSGLNEGALLWPLPASGSSHASLWACGVCWPGEGLSFGTPPFLTEQQTVLLNVSNCILGGVGGEVHKCDCKRSSFRNQDLFLVRTPVTVFHASQRIAWARAGQRSLLSAPGTQALSSHLPKKSQSQGP